MGTGYIRIQTRTGDEALPVSGAHVTLFDSGGKVWYETYTDENGSTETFSLPAPDMKYSLDPDYREPDYSEWGVDVEAKGFLNEHIYNVQVVDTQTSILPVKMKPLVDEPDPVTDEEIDIPPMGLFIPDVREQIGPIETRALTQTVIPDYITVHLGTPTNSAARNVRVRFVDYIKNVTSVDVFQNVFSR